MALITLVLRAAISDLHVWRTHIAASGDDQYFAPPLQIYTVPRDVQCEVSRAGDTAPVAMGCPCTCLLNCDTDAAPPTAHALQDDVIIEPIIQNLGLGDAELEQRIQEQMTALHEFFKRLYDQDQEEIRCVFAAHVCYWCEELAPSASYSQQCSLGGTGLTGAGDPFYTAPQQYSVLAGLFPGHSRPMRSSAKRRCGG